ncbi:MAG: type II secretion system F family protein, partial [Planctomycetaceae bacterium]
MPVYQYEAMDATTGAEVKDTVEAPSEAEAQALVRQKGLFVTRIAEKGRGKKEKDKKKDKDKKKAGGKKTKTFSLGGVSAKKLCTFTRQLST